MARLDAPALAALSSPIVLELDPIFDPISSTHIQPAVAGWRFSDSDPALGHLMATSWSLEVAAVEGGGHNGTTQWQLLDSGTRGVNARPLSGVFRSLRQNGLRSRLLRLTFSPSNAVYSSLEIYRDVNEEVTGSHACQAYDSRAVYNRAGLYRCGSDLATLEENEALGLLSTMALSNNAYDAGGASDAHWKVTNGYSGVSGETPVKVTTFPSPPFASNGPSSAWIGTSAAWPQPYPPRPHVYSLDFSMPMPYSDNWRANVDPPVAACTAGSLQVSVWYSSPIYSIRINGREATSSPPLHTLPANSTASSVLLELNGFLDIGSQALEIVTSGILRVDFPAFRNHDWLPLHFVGPSATHWTVSETAGVAMKDIHYLDRFFVDCPDGYVMNGARFRRVGSHLHTSHGRDNYLDPVTSAVPRAVVQLRESPNWGGLAGQARCLAGSSLGGVIHDINLSNVMQPYGGVMTSLLDLAKVGFECPAGTALQKFRFARSGGCNNPSDWTTGVVDSTQCVSPIGQEGLAFRSTCANLTDPAVASAPGVWRSVGVGAPVHVAAWTSVEQPQLLERVGVLCHHNEYMAGIKFRVGGCDKHVTWESAVDTPPCTGDENNPQRNGIIMEALCKPYRPPASIFANGVLAPNRTHPLVALWLSADELVTSGHAPGSSIGVWPNIATGEASVTLTHAVQKTPWRQPILTALPVGNATRHAVYFDGVDDILRGTGVIGPAVTYFAVFEDIGTSHSCCAGVLISMGSTVANHDAAHGISLAGSGPTKVVLDYPGSADMSTTNVADGKKHVAVLSYNTTATMLWIDGVLENTIPSHVHLNNHIMIGARYREVRDMLEGSGLADRSFKGYLYEALVVNEAVDADAVNAMAFGLMQKHSVAHAGNASCYALPPLFRGSVCAGLGPAACSPEGACTVCPAGSLAQHVLRVPAHIR
ncbi:uncharacterized protein AMSG_11459 [Thecamonas trahens ATCC 50062]|uniref:Uncharacterized protein n=1 Tax=Thecamonas trahens ATCC 50062 TaxID=461836 RepID=A0A0L0DV78_THETB|nr:hypothetical protein AMSG_11459 [Thecamonas trahens ATCC 50062]KNC56209.1 hypothetical protein AMSG_11459 [Thecamonas trahens ATCC 50062]|eukprot:XP_013752667.1 hypothetical protein AMSG_11459 [Thecamonas trahens ATCC 50062]